MGCRAPSREDRPGCSSFARACWLDLAASAHAATLTIIPDKSSYTGGQDITLIIIGDSERAADNGIRGTLLSVSGIAAVGPRSPNTLTSVGAAVPWVTGALPADDPGNHPATNDPVVFSQIMGADSFPVDPAGLALQRRLARDPTPEG